MAGYLKSSDLGPHAHSYGAPHPHHAPHGHGPIPPGMSMASLPFGLPHGLDTSIGFPQGMWGKYLHILFSFYHLKVEKLNEILKFEKIKSMAKVLTLEFAYRLSKYTFLLAMHVKRRTNRDYTYRTPSKIDVFDIKMKWNRNETV